MRRRRAMITGGWGLCGGKGTRGAQKKERKGAWRTDY